MNRTNINSMGMTMAVYLVFMNLVPGNELFANADKSALSSR